MVDTGKTLLGFLKAAKDFGALSIKIFAMLDKACNRAKEANYDIDFVCYKIPNYFIVGYGLDYAS